MVLPTTRGLLKGNSKSSLHPRKFFSNHKVDGNSIDGELTPVSNNVLGTVKEAASETAGGLIIPDTAKEKCYEGTVVAVGPGRIHPETGIKLTMGVKLGEKVIYGKYDGAELQYDDMTHQVGICSFINFTFLNVRKIEFGTSMERSLINFQLFLP